MFTPERVEDGLDVPDILRRAADLGERVGRAWKDRRKADEARQQFCNLLQEITCGVPSRVLGEVQDEFDRARQENGRRTDGEGRQAALRANASVRGMPLLNPTEGSSGDLEKPIVEWCEEIAPGHFVPLLDLTRDDIEKAVELRRKRAARELRTARRLEGRLAR